MTEENGKKVQKEVAKEQPKQRVQEQPQNQGRNIWAIIAIIALVLLAIVLINGCTRLLTREAQTEAVVPEIVVNVVMPETEKDCYTATAAKDETLIPTEVKGEKKPLTFRDGCTADGIYVHTGTIIAGPAMVKFNPDTHDAIVVWTGQNYEITGPNNVVWIFEPAEAETVRTTFPNHRHIYDITGKQLQ